MLELAQLVIKTTGKNAKVVSKLSEDPQYLTDNPVRRCPDLRKSRELLDYIPEVSIDEGLRRMMEFYLEENGAGTG
jgi:nucleoside-diphosphate-sugar epimerase